MDHILGPNHKVHRPLAQSHSTSHSSQRSDYRNGDTLPPNQLATQREAFQRQRFKDLLEKLEGRCSPCWLAGLAYDHRFPRCRNTLRFGASLTECIEFRRGVLFEMGAGCWQCLLPMSYCMKQGVEPGTKANGHQTCRYKDLLLPAFLFALNQARFKESLADFMGLQDLGNQKQITTWMSRKTVRYKKEMSNLWRAFEHIVEMKEGILGED